MEASSHALDQGRLAGLRIDTAVFTNLSRDHLDYHGDMETYARAKGRLFARPGLRAAVINAADPAAPRIRAMLGAEVQLVDYALGTNAQAAVRGRLLSADATGVTLEVRLEDDVVHLHSALIGMPAALNLLAALGVLLARGIDARAAAEALCRVQPVPGRMQPLGGDGAAPGGRGLRPHAGGACGRCRSAARDLPRSLWCVFGAGGERDHGKRAADGRGGRSLRRSPGDHRRQSARRGWQTHRRGHPGRRPGCRPRRRCASSATVPAPSHGPSARPGRTTSCWWRARDTRRTRRWPASAVPSATWPPCAPPSRRAAHDAHVSARGRGHRGEAPCTVTMRSSTGCPRIRAALAAGELFVALRGPNFDGHDFVARGHGPGRRRGAMVEAAAGCALRCVVPTPRGRSRAARRRTGERASRWTRWRSPAPTARPR